MKNNIHNNELNFVKQYTLQEKLNNHPLNSSITNLQCLRTFMEHHVYAVWDFMSLIKTLQNHFAPIKIPWVPPKNPKFSNFINLIVMEEESDIRLSNNNATKYASHFESYLDAMSEIGANIEKITELMNKVEQHGFKKALKSSEIPECAKNFMRCTFDIIKRDQPHELVAVLAFSREELVPKLFKTLNSKLQINAINTPTLFAYFERHVELDGNNHGPMAISLLEELCKGSEKRKVAAFKSAEQALESRLIFWDEIHHVLVHRQQLTTNSNNYSSRCASIS